MPPLFADFGPDEPISATGLHVLAAALLVVGLAWLGMWLVIRRVGGPLPDENTDPT